MVDQLGKTIITVPMCLRGPQSSGLVTIVLSVDMYV